MAKSLKSISSDMYLSPIPMSFNFSITNSISTRSESGATTVILLIAPSCESEAPTIESGRIDRSFAEVKINTSI
jgi:hypothetical protein